MKKIFFATLLFSVSAFSLSVNAQTEADMSVPGEETVVTEADSGPQNIVRIQPKTSSAEDENSAEDAAIRQEAKDQAEKIFIAIDVNGDGIISKDEFMNFHERLIERKLMKMHMTETTPSVDVEAFSEEVEAN